jgi:hypothetical protein
MASTRAAICLAHHLDHVGKHLLPRLFESIERILGHADRNLFQPFQQAAICLETTSDLDCNSSIVWDWHTSSVN